MSAPRDEYERIDLPIEFYNETDEPSDNLREEAEKRILKLAFGHQDIVGAMVKITHPSNNRDNLFEVTITLYMRPEYIAATEQGPVPMGVLKRALDQAERQARSQREKLRNY